MLRTSGSARVPRFPLRKAHAEPATVLIDLEAGAWCEGDCRSSNLCRTCAESVRAEALEWMRDLADWYFDFDAQLDALKIRIVPPPRSTGSRPRSPRARNQL